MSRLLILLVVIAMLVGCLASCEQLGLGTGPSNDTSDNEPNNGNENNDGGNDNDSGNGGNDGSGNNGNTDSTEPEFIDYASQVKFNPNSGRIYAEVEVKSYIDGDTTHFVPKDSSIKIGDMGYVKARYLSINTPESTGVIEPWGKKASNYTKTQLLAATSIIIESNDDKWNLDSTGSRHLLWIWYKTAEDTEYRNLNLEILQQGLAYGSGLTDCVYGDVALAALNQAKTLKLHVFSKAKDPDFYYGGAIELTLKELKSNPTKYKDLLVKFEANIVEKNGVTLYVEEYDEETDMYFGMQIFAGYSFPHMSTLAEGNRVFIVGTLQYYENGGYYQVSNLKYKAIDPDWKDGCHVIGTGATASNTELDVPTILNGTVTFDVIVETEGEDGEITETKETKVFDYSELAHFSSVKVNNLKVKSVWTTVSETDSNGALTITCEDENGNEIKIRTANKLIKKVDGVSVDVVASDFPAGSVLNVEGIIDSYNGEYQIKVFEIGDITFA